MNNKTCKKLRRLTELIAEREGRTKHTFQEVKVGVKQFKNLMVVHPITREVSFRDVEVDCVVIVNTDGPRFIYQRLKKLSKAGVTVEQLEQLLLAPRKAA